jgi:dimethylamine/trimethylamine dehydrogenase
MPRDPRYDILFEKVKIGPVTARNRFYQVPHCNGMGYDMPLALAGMRGMKAEGGWAVVCTEECEIHPSGDVAPYKEARLWDDHDIPALAHMTEAVHRHGSLAGCELVHNGPSCANIYSRMAPIGPSHQPVNSYFPAQARAMDKEDIRNYRRWHREAAIRARRAGFDIIYCYAGHDLSLPMHFLQRRRNDRLDEYGGSLENRVRLLREIIEEAKAAVGDSCAIAVRFATDELLGERGIGAEAEGREVVELLAELPDLWDVNVSPWSNDSTTSRFKPEGSQEPFTAFVKRVTSKPVVGVGRFTSPDSMVSQIRRGILDFIGAARPSIADPFLPKKIEEGRLEDIRECIGCNVCVSGDFTITPIRCTQNPTMGEEWRKGWHPEIITAKGSDDAVLVVGAGPAGLECARALGQRGYHVHLAEAGEELGGRVSRESRLPGLAEWARVRDHRLQQIGRMANVQVYPASRLTADDIREFGFPHAVIATGARWRRDGVGRWHSYPVPGFEGEAVLTPDDIMEGRLPAGELAQGPVVVFDDDHYYMGGVLAERLSRAGLEVTLVTPAELASIWTANTLELRFIQARLLGLGITIRPSRTVTAFLGDHAEVECVYTGRKEEIAARTIVTVTARLPEDQLYQSLRATPGLLKSVRAIGDAYAPSTIAAAVYAGHDYARNLDGPPQGEVPFRRQLPERVAG